MIICKRPEKTVRSGMLEGRMRKAAFAVLRAVLWIESNEKPFPTLPVFR
jgi:hypothetical protein